MNALGRTACIHGVPFGPQTSFIKQYELDQICLNTKTEYYIKNPLTKWDFLESFDIGPILIPCILRTVKARQDHLHITFRDFNEEHKEESIHQHCIKNKHLHTKQNRSFLAP